MVTLWLIHFIRVLVQFRGTDLRAGNDIINGSVEASKTRGDSIDAMYDSDSSDSHRVGSPSLLYPNSSGGLETEDRFSKAYGGSADESGHPEVEESPTEQPMVIEKRKGGLFRQALTFATRTRKLLRYNVGIPITLFIFMYTNYAMELYLSGTPVMTHKYFGWSGITSGLFLGAMGATIIPLHFVCEFIARRYEDRIVLRVSSSSVLCPNPI